jgi:hypothetical protein
MGEHPGEIECAILQLFPPNAAGVQQLIARFQKLKEPLGKMRLGIAARQTLSVPSARR